jgi:uncharacterized Zn finger protein (UPF0148 family)
MDAKTCPHCGGPLVTEHELDIYCCLLCRRFALLRGTWPKINTKEKNMIADLTNTQIARVLELCGKIADVRKELPPAPPGFEVSLEIAKNLRASLERKNDLLLELSALLR